MIIPIYCLKVNGGSLSIDEYLMVSKMAQSLFRSGKNKARLYCEGESLEITVTTEYKFTSHGINGFLFKGQVRDGSYIVAVEFIAKPLLKSQRGTAPALRRFESTSEVERRRLQECN